MSTHAFRNFTVRMTESGLQRIDARAKPFYGGRLSTGEAIRRLAEERLDQIERQETVEPCRDALLRTMRNWRSGCVIPLEDIPILSTGATAAARVTPWHYATSACPSTSQRCGQILAPCTRRGGCAVFTVRWVAASTHCAPPKTRAA